MKELQRILEANRRYAADFEPRPNVVARSFAILTCMDARIDPYQVLGLRTGDAHIIRNAGGVASDDAIRSLLISHWKLGTQEAVVIGHTDCGMATFSDEDLRKVLAEKTRAEVDHLRFLTFKDVDERVRESVRILRETPLLPDSYEVAGLVFDVQTGELRQVA